MNIQEAVDKLEPHTVTISVGKLDLIVQARGVMWMDKSFSCGTSQVPEWLQYYFTGEDALANAIAAYIKKGN